MSLQELKRSSTSLIVRPLKSSDFSSWSKTHLSMPKPKNKWDQLQRPESELSRTAFTKYLKTQHENRKKDYFYDLGIFLKSDQSYIGLCSSSSKTTFFKSQYSSSTWEKV